MSVPRHRTLGSTGIQVSPLCFGVMSFGAEADEQTSGEMYRRARDAGITFFDAADVYAGGDSERILGRLIAGHRDELVLTSKAFFPVSDDPNDFGLSRRHLTRAVEGSLRRLGTDRLEVYFVHSFDPRVPMDETLRTLDELRRQGKILSLGVSNWAAWQIALALGVSAREGLARFQVIEPMYSLVRRQVEVEILPLAADQNMGVISYSPLGGGLLTGKYSTTSRPAEGRLVENPRYADRYSKDTDFAVAEGFTALAAELGVSPASLAVAWVMAHPAITAPIIGARNASQLEGSLGALDIEMTPELYERITSLSPAPAPATDRTELQKGTWAF